MPCTWKMSIDWPKTYPGMTVYKVDQRRPRCWRRLGRSRFRKLLRFLGIKDWGYDGPALESMEALRARWRLQYRSLP